MELSRNMSIKKAAISCFLHKILHSIIYQFVRFQLLLLKFSMSANALQTEFLLESFFKSFQQQQKGLVIGLCSIETKTLWNKASQYIPALTQESSCFKKCLCKHGQLTSLQKKSILFLTLSVFLLLKSLHIASETEIFSY